MNAWVEIARIFLELEIELQQNAAAGSLAKVPPTAATEASTTAARLNNDTRDGIELQDRDTGE
ncbi:MAG: hypothetical protein FOGNACKC_01963 [Anaerolineae bacterium]|nr:hypothetical protein [Anaerolineae bacterium]